MATIVSLRNSSGNVSTGFSISKQENLDNLFPKGIHTDMEFSIGPVSFKVIELQIHRFFPSTQHADAIDNDSALLGAELIVMCSSNDSRWEKENQVYDDLKEYLS